MFFVSLSANIDPEDFAWLVFTRSTQMRLTGYHQRHKLVLSKGDIFGVRKTRSNTYQLVKADAMHIKYRNIQVRTHDSILKNSIPYKGQTPTEQEVEEGFVRRRKVSTRESTKAPNKRTDDYFVPSSKRITEKFEIDQSNYQWRKLKSGPIRVLSKKQGKARGILRAGDIVGMRFRSPGRGGYVLLDGNVRVHVSHEMYTELVHASRVVPDAQQKSDVVDLGRGVSEEKLKEQAKKKKPVKKKPVVPPVEIEEEPIEKLYDIDGPDEDFKRKTKRRANTQRNMRRAVRKLLEVPEQETWVENEDEGFDEEGFEPEDTQPTAEEATPSEEPDVEPEDAEIDEGLEPELDEDEEEPEPEPEAEEDDSRVVDKLEPGTVFRMKKGSGRRFVVVDSNPMERNENLMELTLYDPSSEEQEDFDMYRLRIGVNMPMSKFGESAELEDETYDPQKLKELQDSVEYADIKSISLVK